MVLAFNVLVSGVELGLDWELDGGELDRWGFRARYLNVCNGRARDVNSLCLQDAVSMNRLYSEKKRCTRDVSGSVTRTWRL